MNRPLDAHRAVAHDDAIVVLLDSVDVGFEGPIKQDVRRSAGQSRVVAGREIQAFDCTRAGLSER